MLIFENNEVCTESGERWGSYLPVNPVSGDPIPAASNGHLIIHSGTPADTLFEPHPLSWGAPAQEAFQSWCTRACESGHRLMIRTHARHVLCDATRCVSFREWIEEHDLPIGILLEPETLMEQGMTDDLEDHIERMFRMAGRSIDAVMLGASQPAATISMDDFARCIVEAAKRWGFSGEWIIGEHAKPVVAAAGLSA